MTKYTNSQQLHITIAYAHNPRPAKALPSPTPEDLESKAFNAIWRVVKDWQVDVGDGLSSATGSHVKLILDELKKVNARGKRRKR